MQTLSVSSVSSVQMLESRFAAKRFEAKRFESEAIRSEATGAKRGPEFSHRSTGLQRDDDFRAGSSVGEGGHRFRCRRMLRRKSSPPLFAKKKHRFRCRPVLRREIPKQTAADVEQKLRSAVGG